MISQEYGKTANIVGHAPSLSNYIDFLKDNKEGDLIISVNEVDEFTGLTPDYWLTSNPQYTIPKMCDRINKFPNTKFIYSDVTDKTPIEEVERLLNVEFYQFDWLHFGGKENSFFVGGSEFGCRKAMEIGWIRCCDSRRDRLTIQEILMDVSGYDNHYSTGDTNILHATALAIILGCKKLNIYGVDLDYSKGYIGGHQTGPNGATHGDSFDFWMDRLISDFYIVKKSADCLGIEVNYYGESNFLIDIFKNSITPNKVYPSNCKNYN